MGDLEERMSMQSDLLPALKDIYEALSRRLVLTFGEPVDKVDPKMAEFRQALCDSTMSLGRAIQALEAIEAAR